MNESARWRERLAGRTPPALVEEIDAYEGQMRLRREGRLEERIFQEARLRRGVYGQRYDNGRRHDGIRTREIPYPCGDARKGVETVWDAPGMQRIKIPWGGVTPEQMEVLADVAEEYGDGILHVTTRQDFQIHFVHIDDTPSIMRRLAAVGITTREACGNSVRNVTACPVAGICADETFDVTPHAEAMARFLLGHKDAQDFGRKFKIAFSGCAGKACGLARMHDLGFIAREEGGRRGFEVLVGGGLGPVPYQAKTLEPFVPEEEILPLAQAVARVFGRLGEKKNRNRARLKFLVARLGIDEFRRLVREERKGLPFDERWSGEIARAMEKRRAAPPAAAAPASSSRASDAPAAWRETNVRPQKSPGLHVVEVALPLGDLTSVQLRGLADIVRRFAGAGEAAGGAVRTTVEQNLVLRGVRTADLGALHAALSALGLAGEGAATIADVVACPGTDTCKLGIASSRGLAKVLRERLAARGLHRDPAVRNLRIKVSGCFNSCGQHHVADIGFYGSSRTMGGYAVPHFQVLVGGAWSGNAEAYGLALGTIPSRRAPEVLDRFLDRYRRERRDGETFRAWIGRIGKKEAWETIRDLAAVPPHDTDPSFYADWGDPREFSIGDIGKGECAGEVVSPVEFGLTAAEREVFEAQILLEGDAAAPADPARAAARAYKAMQTAALALVRDRDPDAPDDPDSVVAAFRVRLVEPGLFLDPAGGERFSAFFFAAHDEIRAGAAPDADRARRLVEEAQLFIEAAHACRRKILETAAGAARP